MFIKHLSLLNLSYKREFKNSKSKLRLRAEYIKDTENFCFLSHSNPEDLKVLNIQKIRNFLSLKFPSEIQDGKHN